MSTMERLFQTWYPRVVRAMRGRLGNTDDAEDVAQEAFVRLLGEQEVRGDEPVNPPGWLLAVAERIAVDRHRSKNRRERIVKGRLHADDGQSATDPDEAILRAECVTAVRAVLEGLSERDRQLLLLHHEGWSYRDIARRVGVTESSVGSLLTRAHRRFLAQYQISHCVEDLLNAGDVHTGVRRPRRGAVLATIATASALVVSLLTWHAWPNVHTHVAGETQVQDVCCFDLDGGKRPDDGMLTVSRAGDVVACVVLYEDHVGTHAYAPADPRRFISGPAGCDQQ